METSSLVASYLRTHGFNVSNELASDALKFAQMSMQTVVRKSAVAFAEDAWRANAGEHDRKPGSILDDIFKKSGFSKLGVPRTGPVPDWCGMFVMWALQLSGMDTDFDTSTLHTLNVEAFFTYGKKNSVNPRRLDTEVSHDGGKTWEKIVDWHRREGKLRRWISFEDEPFAESTYGLDLFKPGDVVNLDWKNDGKADHITLVRLPWDMKKLNLIEGNRTGKAPDGSWRREAVVVNDYDVKGTLVTCERNPALRNSSVATLYGVGRPSELDFVQAMYR